MGDNALARINAERCEDELRRVEAAVSRLINRPAKVDFYSVATESGVSRSTLYRNAKLRALVEAARDSQPDPWELIGQLTAEKACLRAKLIAAEARSARECMIEYEIEVISLVA